MTERVNWEEIRAEYISDAKSTYRSLGEKYGVSENAVSVRSRGENWREQRRRRSEDVSQMIIQRRTQEDVERFMQVSNTAQTLIDRIESAVKDEEQFYRYIVDGSETGFDDQDADGSSVRKAERIFGKMDTRALREMTSALKDALEILRRANRIPTVEGQLQHDAAMERLKFDRERFAAAMKEGDRAVQIRFDDGFEDYGG